MIDNASLHTRAAWVILAGVLASSAAHKFLDVAPLQINAPSKWQLGTAINSRHAGDNSVALSVGNRAAALANHSSQTEEAGEVDDCMLRLLRGPSRYVRIELEDKNTYLGICDISSVTPTGQEVLPYWATLGSTLNESFVATNCIDGKPGTCCHSEMWRQHLTVQFHSPDIDTLRVVNRVCEAGNCASRIVGSTIKLTLDPGGKYVLWSSTFFDARKEYIFKDIKANSRLNGMAKHLDLHQRPCA